MRKKERNGPGIATYAGSGDPTLASSDGKESGGVVPRAAGAKHEPTERVAARIRGRWKKHLAHRLLVKRSVWAFKISSPESSLNGTVQMQRKNLDLNKSKS